MPKLSGDCMALVHLIANYVERVNARCPADSLPFTLSINAPNRSHKLKFDYPCFVGKGKAKNLI